MPNRIEKKVNIQIENFDVAIYTKAHRDIVRVMPDIHKNYKFGILVADIMGHKKEKASKIEERLLKNQHSKWYKKESATKALKNLCEKINKEKANHIYDSDDVDDFQMSSMLYFLFTKNSINYANSAMYPPIILRKNQLIELKEKGPPIGFFKIKKENIFKLKKGDILFTYTDGFTDNCLGSGKIPEELRTKAEEKIKFPENPSKLLSIENISNYYENELIKIVEENPGEKIEKLRAMAISKIEEKHRRINIEEEISKECKATKEYKTNADAKIMNIMETIRNNLKNKIFETLKENQKKRSQELINIIFENHYNYIFPDTLKREDDDDVSIVIVKSI